MKAAGRILHGALLMLLCGAALAQEPQVADTAAPHQYGLHAVASGPPSESALARMLRLLEEENGYLHKAYPLSPCEEEVRYAFGRQAALLEEMLAELRQLTARLDTTANED